MQHSQLGFRWFRRPTVGNVRTCRLASSMNSSTRWFASLVTYARTPTGRPSESSAKETLAHARWRTGIQRTTDQYGPVRCCSSATQSAYMCTEGVNTFVLSSRSEPLSKRRCRTEASHTNTAIRNTPQRQRRALHRANAGLTGEGPCIPAASLWRAPTAHECRRRSPPMRAPPHAAGRRAETARVCRRQRRRSQPARSHSRPSSTCG